MAQEDAKRTCLCNGDKYNKRQTRFFRDWCLPFVSIFCLAELAAIRQWICLFLIRIDGLAHIGKNIDFAPMMYDISHY